MATLLVALAPVAAQTEGKLAANNQPACSAPASLSAPDPGKPAEPAGACGVPPSSVPPVSQSSGAVGLLNGTSRETGAAEDFKPYGEDRHAFAWGAETDCNSSYVWRGIVLSDKPVAQPSVWASRAGFTFVVWSNFALNKASEMAHFHLADLTLTYSRDWKKVTIEPTLETYLGRSTSVVPDSSTLEGSLKLSYPAGPFRLFTSHAFDLLAYRGSYFGEAGLGYETAVTKRIALASSLRSGWASSKFNDVYIGLRKPAFNFVGAEGSLTYYVNRSLYFQPHFELSKIADRRLREYLPRPSVFNFGLAMGVEF